jgi:hypothetical protein
MSESWEIAKKLVMPYRSYLGSIHKATVLDAAVRFTRMQLRSETERTIENVAWMLHQIALGNDGNNLFMSLAIVIDLARLNMLDSKNDPAKYASQIEAIETIERLYDL